MKSFKEYLGENISSHPEGSAEYHHDMADHHRKQMKTTLGAEYAHHKKEHEKHAEAAFKKGNEEYWRQPEPKGPHISRHPVRIARFRTRHTSKA